MKGDKQSLLDEIDALTDERQQLKMQLSVAEQSAGVYFDFFHAVLNILRMRFRIILLSRGQQVLHRNTVTSIAITVL